MKNRRSVVIAFLMATILCLGVGYAALSDTLETKGYVNLNTSAATADFNEDVYFDAASIDVDWTNTETDKVISPQVLRQTNGDENDMLQFTIPEGILVHAEDHKDKVTVTVDILNTSAYEVEVTPAYSLATGAAYTVECDQAKYILPAAIDESTPGRVTITITVELQTEVTSPVTGEEFVITYTAETVNA